LDNKVFDIFDAQYTHEDMVQYVLIFMFFLKQMERQNILSLKAPLYLTCP